MNPTLTPARSALARELAALRRPLLTYCYRMLGSALEAEDAVQETMMRAWRSADRLTDPAGLRPWMYRIATNVCIDATTDRRRRALPMDLVAAADPRGDLGAALPESTWVQPFPSASATGDPSEEAVSRESIRLAFVAALQYLLPRQRAVLILRDVLCWRAAEVAELLDTSVDAINSMLRRARSALAAAGPEAGEPIDTGLLERYVAAFERFDIDGIVALLRHDAVIDMPPVSFWLRGREAFRQWLTHSEVGCRRKRLVPIEANGCPAAAVYREHDGRFEAVGIQVLVCSGGEISELHVFLQPELFRIFGLPETLG
ncbi:RNA polymerase sigma-70 factor (ECF subfamily) [Nocardia transvalensis]|uniref:RNA polymerase sigma-70 factor (ECF subfamily) n=1 Tax=Nocardia transvalensis TaxID=37333 RepID=A0A7W9PGZ1_9NOCA|nr:RNA polymerase subunit sigma-70 [Nocardia transvalensis]MBB5915861.1 RNA polymerase sigma-70 factor (ECF subfamily) [Nocardia transvalensis]